MGSFDQLLNKAAPAVGSAFGGPVGGAIASFGTSALTGGDFGQALGGGLSSLGGSAVGGAGGAAASKAGTGQKLLSNLGFNNDLGNNIATGGNLLLSTRNQLPMSTDFMFTLPPQKPLSLLDTLNQRVQ